jgi:hypothetical protein
MPMEPTDPLSAEVPAFLEAFRQSFTRPAPGPQVPRAPSVAISRETASRGGSIARRVGQALGWQVYPQSLLEYLAQEPRHNRDLFDALDPTAQGWVEDQHRRLHARYPLDGDPTLTELVRVVLAIGARGEAVLVGRGAGCILPRATTLHVRVAAPLEDRITYMAQLGRLTRDQAAVRVEDRDRQRAAFLADHFHFPAGDTYRYDLVLNSALLGEELSAALVAAAVRFRLDAQEPPAGPVALG